jgi:hypothetical protein
MKGAQAGDDARRDTLSRQLGAGATEPRDPAAAAEETADGGGGAPVILQASKTTLVQQFRWERALGELSVFLRGEELTCKVIGVGGGMNYTGQELPSSTRRWRAR